MVGPSGEAEAEHAPQVRFVDHVPSQTAIAWARSLEKFPVVFGGPVSAVDLVSLTRDEGVPVLVANAPVLGGADFVLRIVDGVNLGHSAADAAVKVVSPPAVGAPPITEQDALVLQADTPDALHGVVDLIQREPGRFQYPAHLCSSGLVAMTDECRFSGGPCPAAKNRELFASADGSLRPCRRGPVVGRVGDAQEALARVESGRIPECESCFAAPWCSRCPVELAGPHRDFFCQLTRSRVMHRVVNLLKASRVVVTRVGPPHSGEGISLGDPVPPEVSSPRDGEPGLPRPSLGVGVIKVGDSHFAVRLEAGSITQLGDTLAEVFALSRDGASRASAVQALARTYELPPDQASAAVDQALGALEASGLISSSRAPS
jgi:hypothetical protein